MILKGSKKTKKQNLIIYSNDFLSIIKYDTIICHFTYLELNNQAFLINLKAVDNLQRKIFVIIIIEMSKALISALLIDLEIHALNLFIPC